MPVVARVLLLLVAVCITACDTRNPSTYHIAVANAVHSEANASAFNRLYPTSDNFITYYDGRYGQPRWNSKTLLFGRYELTMQFDIDIDRSGTIVTAIESPQFWLSHRRHVQRLPDGRLMMSYQSEGSMEFGPVEWQQLIGAGGDLSALGIKPIENSPISESSTPAPEVTHPAEPTN